MPTAFARLTCVQSRSRRLGCALISILGGSFFASFARCLISRSIQTEKPNLVFLDVMMPKLSGFDVCERAKKTMGLTDVHIILLTAKGQEFDRQRGQEVGADLYMTKPFDPDALLQKARDVLGPARRGAQLGEAVAQERQVDGEDVEAVVKVLAELVLLDHLLEVALLVAQHFPLLAPRLAHNIVAQLDRVVVLASFQERTVAISLRVERRARAIGAITLGVVLREAVVQDAPYK